MEENLAMIKEICKRCSEETYLVNMTHKLCSPCNHIRLHGETLQETQSRKAMEYVEKRKDKGTVLINKVSDKQKAIRKELGVVKNRISAIRDMQCQGCMKQTDQLDRSHILSIAQRSELQLDERNINLLCRNCHEKWESGDIVKMTSLLTFQKDMRYIFDKDGSRFQKILHKLEDNSQNNQRIAYIYGIISGFEDYFCNKFENGKDRCQNQCVRCASV